MAWLVYESHLPIMFAAFEPNLWQPGSISMIMKQQQQTGHLITKFNKLTNTNSVIVAVIKCQFP